MLVTLIDCERRWRQVQFKRLEWSSAHKNLNIHRCGVAGSHALGKCRITLGDFADDLIHINLKDIPHRSLSVILDLASSHDTKNKAISLYKLITNLVHVFMTCRRYDSMVTSTVRVYYVSQTWEEFRFHRNLQNKARASPGVMECSKLKVDEWAIRSSSRAW